MVKKGQKQEGLQLTKHTSKIVNLHKFSALAVAVTYVGW